MEQILHSLSYIIPFLVVLTIVVFIHELGHFLVARYNGVKVEVFSIGFGPELFGWDDSAGTRWKVSMIPLGGYIKMLGDADASSRPDEALTESLSAEDKAKTLQSKTVGQRIAVVTAGPAANYILAVVLMAGLFMYNGEPQFTNTIGKIAEHSVGYRAGLQAGDKITKINETSINKFTDLVDALKPLEGHEIQITVEREGATSPVVLNGEMMKIDPNTHEKKPIAQLGIAPSGYTYEKHGALDSVKTAFSTVWNLSVKTLQSLGQMIMGKRSADELGGILAIGEMAGKSAKSGFVDLIWFIALLSVNLGLINLLPIPVLDGGHILFYSIEGIRGKPVSPKVQEYAFLAGLVFVLSIMLFSTWNDLSRLKFFSWLGFGK